MWAVWVRMASILVRSVCVLCCAPGAVLDPVLCLALASSALGPSPNATHDATVAMLICYLFGPSTEDITTVAFCPL